MQWGDLVRTPHGEVGELGDTAVLYPENVEIAEVEVGCFLSYWRLRDLTPATFEELLAFMDAQGMD